MKVIIVGAGISGLSAALELRQASATSRAEIIVLEPERDRNGVPDLDRREGHQIECGDSLAALKRRASVSNAATASDRLHYEALLERCGREDIVIEYGVRLREVSDRKDAGVLVHYRDSTGWNVRTTVDYLLMTVVPEDSGFAGAAVRAA